MGVTRERYISGGGGVRRLPRRNTTFTYFRSGIIGIGGGAAFTYGARGAQKWADRIQNTAKLYFFSFFFMRLCLGEKRRIIPYHIWS